MTVALDGYFLHLGIELKDNQLYRTEEDRRIWKNWKRFAKEHKLNKNAVGEFFSMSE